VLVVSLPTLGWPVVSELQGDEEASPAPSAVEMTELI
jgi:hypothetical protein